MADHEVYEGFLWTGSGAQKVTFELGADRARIVIEYRWMGQDTVPARCELRSEHGHRTDWHGELDLLDVATTADAGSVPLPMPSDEDALLPLKVEYLRAARTPVRVHPRSQLVLVRSLGYAGWNEHFDLLLLVDDLAGWPEGVVWEHVRARLDKAKLTKVE